MGALTAGPLAFSYRNWEFHTRLFVDVTDSFTPPIRVDARGSKILRILPLGQWISNKMRFLAQGLYVQRFSFPLYAFSCTYVFDLCRGRVVQRKEHLLYEHFDRCFHLLSQRLRSPGRSTLQVIHGALYGRDLDFLQHLQSPSLRVRHYASHRCPPEGWQAPPLEPEERPWILLNTNPRLDSPSFHVNLRESSSEFYALGSYHYDFPVQVLGASSRLLRQLALGQIFPPSTTLLFSQGSLGWSSLFPQFTRFYLLPLWIQNQFLRSPLEPLPLGSGVSDVSLLLAPPSLFHRPSSFSVLCSTHRESQQPSTEVFLPFGGYLESSLSFWDSSKEYHHLPALHHSFGLTDLMTAFFLYHHRSPSGPSTYSRSWTPSWFPSRISRVPEDVQALRPSLPMVHRLVHHLVTLPVPNVYTTDPLSRSNQFFRSLVGAPDHSL